MDIRRPLEGSRIDFPEGDGSIPLPILREPLKGSLDLEQVIYVYRGVAPRHFVSASLSIQRSCLAQVGYAKMHFLKGVHKHCFGVNPHLTSSHPMVYYVVWRLNNP